MQLFPYQYFHLYNRSIGNELVFRSRENYIFFLRKYRFLLEEYIDTIAYCLMPTHFHFLIFIKKDDIMTIKKRIGILLRSYTNSYNIKYNRHGSLFQQHTKSKIIDDDSYIITLLTYIHQNPIRTGIVKKAEEYEFSSYQDYIDLRNGTLPTKSIILERIKINELKEITDIKIQNIDKKFWI
jgi:putative transposase